MHILIAPNSFKQSLSAEEAALAIRQGFEESQLECECECFPVGDGGDGTGELIITKFTGRVIETQVHDPLGRIIKASFGLIENGNTAVIEMAGASGLHLLKNEELNPLIATSFGTGEQIVKALERGVNKIIIAMGGSATVDAGCGILKALGLRFLNKEKKDLLGIPGNLIELITIDISGIDERIFDCEVVVLCDVDNLLLGEKGAAAMFGPQKGASANVVRLLNAALSNFAEVMFQKTGKNINSIKYGGTAGGAAAGLYGLLNAELVNGIDYFLELTGFDESLNKADLVITGEGKIDEQTLQGKAPFGVSLRAKQKGIPVIGIAGTTPEHPTALMLEYFNSLYSINPADIELNTALSTAGVNLRRTAKEIGNMLATK
jgi:glycerate 2-kinase